MPASLVAPEIEGYAEVADFIDENGMLESVLAVYELAWRLHPTATRVRLEKYVDHEDGNVSVFVFISGVAVSVDELIRLDAEWCRQIVRAIPGDHSWRIGHDYE